MAERSVVKNGDNFLLSLLGQYGAAHYHDDIQPAVYRVHQGGVWSMLDEKSRYQAQATTWLMISNYYRRVGQDAVAEVWWQRFAKLSIAKMPTTSLLKELFIRITFARKFRALFSRIRVLMKSSSS